MKIINTNKDLTPRDTYKLTKNPGIKKMRDAVSQRLEVKNWCNYFDEKEDGTVAEILAIETMDGDVYATNSDTFRRDFMEMLEIGVADEILIMTGKSKSGRDFITCCLAD